MEFLYVLYRYYLKGAEGSREQRDRFLMSKGHASLALYIVLAEVGLLGFEELETYCQSGSRLAGHPEHVHLDAVEITTGSLGHALSVGVGMALAGAKKQEQWEVVVMLGDGECNEGSVWEGLMCGAQLKLNNLLCVIDANQYESLDKTEHIMGLEPLVDRLTSFGWAVWEADGNDPLDISRALQNSRLEKFRPRAIVSRTIKGYGSTLSRGVTSWHYRRPSPEEVDQIVGELKS
jgi:transketolase